VKDLYDHTAINW